MIAESSKSQIRLRTAIRLSHHAEAEYRPSIGSHPLRLPDLQPAELKSIQELQIVGADDVLCLYVVCRVHTSILRLPQTQRINNCGRKGGRDQFADLPASFTSSRLLHRTGDASSYLLVNLASALQDRRLQRVVHAAPANVE